MKTLRTTQQKSRSLTFRPNRKKRRRKDHVHPFVNLQQTLGNKAVGRLIQAKLKVNKPGDQFEQEAEQVADRVMSRPETPVQRQMEAPEEKGEMPREPVEEEEVQRQAREEEGPVIAKKSSGRGPVGTPTAQAKVNSLRGGGKPLPKSVRHFFEPRFGVDFSQVRVHTNTQATASAKRLNAKAFTIGKNLVFGAGHYSPETSDGKKLLAHELTHVVQQAPDSVIQRKPDQPTGRTDVVFLMTDGLAAEAAVLAPQGVVIRVKSLDEMAKALEGINYPIGRLYIIAHSMPTGDLGFDDENTQTYVLPSNIATALKGKLASKNAPQVLDFRGCSIGSSPESMDKIRAAIGAKAAVGGNCYNITSMHGPIVIGEVDITKPSQVTKDNRQSFEAGMKLLVDQFGDAKHCILDRSEKAYFRAGGKMVAQWFSPEFDTNWDERKSKCYDELKPELMDPSKGEDVSPGLAGHCRLIKVKGK